MKRSLAIAILLLATSCAPRTVSGDELPSGLLFPLPKMCGPTAAMRIGRPKSHRTNPPACELPTAEQVALSCAIHDVVRSPGYKPPPDEWEEPNPDYQPTATPVYVGRNAVCRFTNDDDSKAECTIELSRPQDNGTFKPMTVQLTHIFYAMHGPTSHWYGTRWDIGGECEPDDLTQKP